MKQSQHGQIESMIISFNGEGNISMFIAEL